MPGSVCAVPTLAAIALLAASLANAQVPDPTSPTPRPASLVGGVAGPNLGERNPCRSASRVATFDERERVAVLCPDSLELAAIHDLTDLLSSRIPGVLVQETSGTPGTASRIRIRGP